MARIKQRDNRADIEFMLFNPKYSRAEDKEKRELLIESILSDQSLNDLGLQFCYPKSPGSIGDDLQEPTQKNYFHLQCQTIPDLCPLEKEIMKKSAYSMVKYREETYHHSASSANGLDIPLRSLIAYEACRELRTRLFEQGLDNITVFISYPYTHNGEELFNVAKRVLESHKIRVITGRHLDGSAPIRNEVIDKIKSCFGFVGIWKYDQVNGATRFSPWLMWELGVAQSLDMPVRIFPHTSMKKEDFEPHKKINPEIYMPEFTDVGFEEIVKKHVTMFLKSVESYERSRLLKGPNIFSYSN